MTIHEHFNAVSPYDLKQNPFQLIGKDWFLITAGNSEKYNTMTAGWGSFGVLWNKAVITTYIRPTRYTYEFSEENDFFTVCFFEEKHRKTLAYCGKYSGKDVDKIAECGLTPLVTPNNQIVFAEANLAMECKKIYIDDLQPKLFLDPSIDKHYPDKDYHRSYIGEILNCWEAK
ncbi:MAG: flavin reductase family protein [Bacteroidetes bacterium]|nr:flavin reductase family protein [Bacteroidota bacterium]